MEHKDLKMGIKCGNLKMSVFALCPHYWFKLRIKESDFVQIKYSLSITADSN